MAVLRKPMGTIKLIPGKYYRFMYGGESPAILWYKGTIKDVSAGGYMEVDGTLATCGMGVTRDKVILLSPTNRYDRDTDFVEISREQFEALLKIYGS